MINEKIRIIHLEDLEFDAEMVKLALKKSGLNCDIILADNKANYEKALEIPDLDIILSDHSLPSYSSVEALETARKKLGKIPFILITATVSEEFAVSMMKQGIDDYILKDRLQRLAPAIINAIEKNRFEREREKYLAEIIDQGQRFRAMIENISDSIVLLDGKGAILYNSPTELRGHNMPELRGASFFDLCTEEDVKLVKAQFETALRQPGIPVQCQFRLKKNPSGYLWVEGTINNLLDNPGVQALILNFRDITLRKEAEELLRKSEANLLTIVNNTELAYVLLNQELKIVTFNQKAMKRYKEEFNKTPIEGAYFLDYLDELPEEKNKTLVALYEKALTGEKMHYETNFILDDATMSWHDVNIFPVFDESKHILGLIVTTEDISQKKQEELEKEKMTAQIVQHNKNLEQFAYIISHNLRSPVANILGISHLIEASPKMSKADFKKCVEGLISSIKKLDEVIVDLNFILQKRTSISEKKETINLNQLVSDIKVLIGKHAHLESVSIRTDFSAANEVFTIKSFLHSILLNLIINSIKYRNPATDSFIEITTEKKGGKVVFSLKDNGLGIDMETHGEKLFGLYKKFHPHIEGKGMGLYMVKTQVELLQGSISVESAVNKGTTFRFSID